MNNRMDAEADLDEDDEEELFNTEAALAHPTTYTWEDKYRPRKPRYLNRVHTGYEWNKYNQTHYEYVPRPAITHYPNQSRSSDNPPPKVVQGYKVMLICSPYLDPADMTSSSTYSIPTSSTSQRLQHTRSSKNRAMRTRFFYSSLPVHRTRT
jgi:hypothetical protein